MENFTETVKGQKKLLIERPIPSLQSIAERMVAKFGDIGSQLTLVIIPCAEEAERMLLEVTDLEWVSSSRPMVINILGKKTVYHCSRCNCSDVKRGYLFCPACGVRIEWTKNVIRKAQPITQHSFHKHRKTYGNLYGGPNQVYNPQT